MQSATVRAGDKHITEPSAVAPDAKGYTVLWSIAKSFAR
jgi:hypothetical protein